MLEDQELVARSRKVREIHGGLTMELVDRLKN